MRTRLLPALVVAAVLIVGASACTPTVRDSFDPFSGVTTYSLRDGVPTSGLLGPSVIFGVSVTDEYQRLCLDVTYLGLNWIFLERFRFLADGAIYTYSGRAERTVSSGGGAVIVREELRVCTASREAFRAVLDADSVLLRLEGRSRVTLELPREFRARFEDFYAEHISRLP